TLFLVFELFAERGQVVRVGLVFGVPLREIILRLVIIVPRTVERGCIVRGRQQPRRGAAVTGWIRQLDTLRETTCPRLRWATGGPDCVTKLLGRLLGSKVLAVCADVFRCQLLVRGEQHEPE